MSISAPGAPTAIARMDAAGSHMARAILSTEHPRTVCRTLHRFAA